MLWRVLEKSVLMQSCREASCCKGVLDKCVVENFCYHDQRKTTNQLGHGLVMGQELPHFASVKSWNQPDSYGHGYPSQCKHLKIR